MPKSGRSHSPKKGAGGGEKEGERTEKLSRSTIACNGCRMRKQKCGGEKGPSKGYNESLELRLRETETIVLSLLAVVLDEQLSSLNAFEIPEGDVISSAADKKLKLEEWANFPLRSREDVITWRDGRLSKDARYQSPADVEPGLEMRMDVGDDVRMDNGGVDAAGMAGGAMEVEGMDQPMDNIRGVGIQGLESLNPMEHMQTAEFENYPPPVEQGQSSATEVRSQSMASGSGMLGLSKEFQDTFLW